MNNVALLSPPSKSVHSLPVPGYDAGFPESKKTNKTGGGVVVEVGVGVGVIDDVGVNVGVIDGVIVGVGV